MFAIAIDKRKHLCYTVTAPPQKGIYEGLQGILDPVHHRMAEQCERRACSACTHGSQTAANDTPMMKTAERNQLSAVLLLAETTNSNNHCLRWMLLRIIWDLRVRNRR